MVALVGGLARADRLQDLCRALTQDPSYKVRVQAALILGKMADKRALDSLKVALRDENESVRGVAATSLGRIGDRDALSALQAAQADPSEFVRSQAKKAADMIQASAGLSDGGGVTLTVGFSGKAPGNDIVRGALLRELARISGVTMAEGNAAVGKHGHSFVVDGSVQRLSAGGGQVDCDIKAWVATNPDKAIKMLTTEGASLSASGGEVEGAKRECLKAAAEAIKEDVGKFLRTVK